MESRNQFESGNENMMADIELYQKKIMECEQEIGKGIIGQREVIR